MNHSARGWTATLVFSAALIATEALAQGSIPGLGVGQSMSGAMTRDTPMTADRAGRFDCYALNAPAGASLALTLSSPAFPPKLSIGRGATCAGANYQFVQTSPPDAREVTVVFKAAPGRYLVMVQAPEGRLGGYTLSAVMRDVGPATGASGAPTGQSRREIMQAQVDKRRTELAAEEARRQDDARRREEARLQAEADAARAEAERLEAAAAQQAEAEEEEARPAPNLAAVFANSFNQAMQQNEAERRQQQQFLNGLAEQQRAAQEARAQRERAQLARQQAAERADQARQLAAANAAQRQAAADALARRQQQEAAEQVRRQGQQRQAQQAALPQRPVSSPASAPRNVAATTPATGSAGRSSTQDDPMRCVARPTISKGSLCQGALNVSTINGCSQPVDIRLCLKKDGRWDCGTGWGVQPQQSFSYPVCNATSEAFMGARSSTGGGAMPSPQ